jgi:hypothetical protein
LKNGISNSVLVAQVHNTAAWLWQEPAAAGVTALLDGAVDEPLDDGASLLRVLRLRLAAHYATVATFVPTDVDAHIRHHLWVAIGDPDVFTAACGLIEEAVAREPNLVSERVTDGLAGHDGEWLSVRAGALGRALVLGLDDEALTLAGEIDAELDREERAFADALARGAPATTVLALATTVAHNLGDLSRVVEAWPRAAQGRGYEERYTRLGHAGAPQGRASFVRAGGLNKDLMALENHRFLALRKPRALRRSRDLLLPVGPWFDAWGEGLVSSPHLDDGDRAEVVAALIDLHLRSPDQLGCLRALAGLHRATRGGLAHYAAALPARTRKEIVRGRIRAALDVSPEQFGARMEKRLRAALAR